MKWLIDFIRPPEDATLKEVRRWNFNVSLSVIFGGLFAIWSVTPYGFAYAGDLKQVDEKIAKAVAPTNAKLDHISKLLTEQLASAKATGIRLAISKRCKTQGFTERDELLREKDRLQEEYRTLKGEFYREPTCAEL